MSWKLEVTEVFLNDSDKYLANKYPGVGVFKCGNDLMAVTSHPVGAAYSIPGGAGILAASLPAPPEPEYDLQRGLPPEVRGDRPKA